MQMCMKAVLIAMVCAQGLDEAPAASSPVARVIALLTNLKTSVVEEGEAEAITYDQFACFCKTTTDAKVLSITDGDSDSTGYAASLAEDTAKSNSLAFKIQTDSNELSSNEASLARATELRDNARKAYEETHLDTTNAVNGLASAIASITDSKDTADLVQVKSSIRQTLALSEAVGFSSVKIAKVQALLQNPDFVDPGTPENDYDFHSGGIIELLTGLHTEWTSKKTTMENEETAEVEAFNSAADAKRTIISDLKDAIEEDELQKGTTDEDIADDSKSKTETDAALADDKTYLKDLTQQCEMKAREWDQRSTLRNNEVSALTTALDIISGQVLGNETASGAGGRPTPAAATDLIQKAAPVDDDEQEDTYADVVFVQTQQLVRKAGADAPAKKRIAAIALLKKEALKMNSAAMSVLVMQVAADPFAKVKQLVQKLIERLVTESNDEATHKGWCDTALAESEHDRTYRHGDTKDLASSIESGDALKAKLEQTEIELVEKKGDLSSALNQTTILRDAEQTANRATIEAAQQGLDALIQAITVLKDFYRKSSRASTSFVEVKASPVDADRAAQGVEGNKGAYKGNQAVAGGIMGMLETIKSDFQRTVKDTTAAEYQANREFVKFRIATNSSIHATKRRIQQTQEDHMITSGKLVNDLHSLQENQGLLDDALKALEVLRPACVDTAMSWDDKVTKRTNEIDALKNALCVLDEEDNEYSDKCPQNTGLFLQKK